MSASAVLICGVVIASGLGAGTAWGNDTPNVTQRRAALLVVPENPALEPTRSLRISPGSDSVGAGLFVPGSKNFGTPAAVGSSASIQNCEVPSPSGMDDDSQEVDATIASVLGWHLDVLLSTTPTGTFPLDSLNLPKAKLPP
ncbi:MAG TPA: hypothetical protein VKA67_06700 [Verrucomicrobiae bacterium]|nr:hypothetical protein [Verrucomicrobiae bacterium]